MAKNSIKKILTIDDLENFYSKYKRSTHFSSKESGYQLAVQVPATFKKDEEVEDDTLFYGKVKAFHIGVNRNHSDVTESAAKKAMKTMAYKPVLANFCEYEDDNGNLLKDFTAHDMCLDQDGNIQYAEHQIGCFTADEPWIEHDDDLDKDFVYAYVAIPRDYTDAVDIIERKNGTKVSVELLVNELNYNAKTKVMELTDVTVSGITCLGTNPDTGKPVEEGMLGSRLDIKDFSKSNNSMFSSITDEEQGQLVEMREKIDNLLTRFNINKNYEKGGNIQVEKNNEEIEVKEEVTMAEEVEVTETEESTEEVTEAATENESEETVEDNTPEVVEDEACKKKHEEEAEEVTEEVTEDEACGEKDDDEDKEKFDDSDSSGGTDTTGDADDGIDVLAEGEDDDEDDTTPGVPAEDDTPDDVKDKKKYSVEFELSHDDVRCALYQLLEPYCEADNEWYWISQVYDDHFIYEGCMGNYFGQKYTKDGDAVAFDGERYELFAEFLTKSEVETLKSMRTNYVSISEKLDKYEKAELNAEKEAVLGDTAYAEFSETEGFKEIKSKLDTYSLDELRTACDLAFAKEVKAKGNFALNTEKPVEKKPNFFAFAKAETDSPFLDKLLKK